VKIHPLDKSRPVLDISQKVSVLTDLIQEVMSELSNNINERLKPYLGGSTKDTFTSSDNGTKSAMLSLNGRNFEDLVLKSPDVVLVAFVAPWCGHCKRLLPEWEEAAKRLQGSGAILGVVDATIEKGLATEWGIKSYPTIKAFPGGPKTVKSAIHYEDGRVADQIVDYALNLVDSTGIQTDKVPQLISREMLSKECNQPGRVCIISGLPHILESGAEGRNTYKDVIKNATKAARGLNFKFLWFEGSAQPALEQALEMTNGFPAVVAIRTDKSIYSVQRTAFSESHIRKFITGLTMGKEPTFPLQSMPEILSTEAWDGKDAERYEDEPLDDIMNDEF
jgi:protein disulfide-isomerase A6